MGLGDCVPPKRLPRTRLGTNEMRVAIFGGSFDPIHHGHLIAARVAGEALGADQVRFIPTGRQPLKAGNHHAEGAHRAALTGLAIRGCPTFVMDRREIDRPGPSYTIDTLDELSRELPGAELWLLLGADAMALFSKWRDPAGIRRLAKIMVFRRGEAVEWPEPADRTVTVPQIDISSTAVRDRVRGGKPIRFWVPEAVEAYIAEHGLYRK